MSTSRRESTTTRLRAELVSGNYFQVLGVSARLGRVFSSDDDRAPGAHPVVVLAHSAWRRAFAGRDDIVGQSILVNGQPFAVVGVASQEFLGPRTGFVPDLWAPLTMTYRCRAGPSRCRPTRTTWSSWLGYGRAPRSEASKRPSPPLTIAFWSPSILVRLAHAPTSIDSCRRERIGLSLLRGQYQQPLTMLLGMVTLLAVVAYANVANLLLARGVARRKELAVRLSLGATRADWYGNRSSSARS